MEFLDNASAIEPDREDNPNLAEGTLKHSPDASFYFFTVGSLKDIEQIKRMTLALPRSASCVVLQASAGANRGIRRFANFTLATIGDLDDLPLIMGGARMTFDQSSITNTIPLRTPDRAAHTPALPPARTPGPPPPPAPGPTPHSVIWMTRGNVLRGMGLSRQPWGQTNRQPRTHSGDDVCWRKPISSTCTAAWP